MGIVPSTYNRGLGLMLAPLATSRPRYLATSPVEPSRFHPPSPRVPEMHGPTLYSATCPLESRLLGTSCLGAHDSRILYATCIPLALCYGPHYSSCRDITFPRPHDPHGQILGPFLVRSRDTIPRSDPTVLLCSKSNGYPSFATSRPRDLEYPMFGFSTCEFLSSRDLLISTTCPLLMDNYDLLAPSSPHILAPRDFAHPILGLLPYELLSSRDHSISCHLSLQMDGSQPPRHLATCEAKGLPFRSSNARVCEMRESPDTRPPQ
jgi:hypothetical protein